MDERQLMNLFWSLRPSEKQVCALTYIEWKDGIDIQVPNLFFGLLVTALRAEQPGALPHPDVQWLWTHCRAIGMTAKSDSGSMRDDIALFTIDLRRRAEQAEQGERMKTEQLKRAVRLQDQIRHVENAMPKFENETSLYILEDTLGREAFETLRADYARALKERHAALLAEFEAL